MLESMDWIFVNNTVAEAMMYAVTRGVYHCRIVEVLPRLGPVIVYGRQKMCVRRQR